MTALQWHENPDGSLVGYPPGLPLRKPVAILRPTADAWAILRPADGGAVMVGNAASIAAAKARAGR